MGDQTKGQSPFQTRPQAELMTYADNRIITLASQDAIYKYNDTFLSNVEFQLTGLLREEPDIQRVDVQLVNAQIPISFYNVNYTNNTLKIKLDTDPILTLPLTVGNYNANTLIAEIHAKINDNNFLTTIDQTTGKLTFTHNKSFIIYNDFTGSIGTILGFAPNTVNTSTLINPCTLTPPHILNLLGIKRITIASVELQSYNISSSYKAHVLGVIPVDSFLWGMINYHNQTGNTHIVKQKTLDKIDIQLLDEQNNYINFNNCDWTITLSLNIIRKYTPAINLTFKDILVGTKQGASPLRGTLDVKQVPGEAPSYPAKSENKPEPPISDLDILEFQ